MAARALALVLLLSAPVLLPAVADAGASPRTLPPEDGRTLEASHEFWAPFMHLAALDVPKGIRPGAWLVIGPAHCSAAFVVKDGTGALYLTTAAHCTQRVGQRAAVKEGALVAGLGTIEEFGTVVAAWPSGLDAALIRIDADKYDLVDPSMPGWGGPVGVATGPLPSDTDVLHYGWGWVTWYEHQTRCRRGDLASAGGSIWWARTTGGGGDSGSAAMTSDGRALGIIDWGREITYEPVGGAFVARQLGGVRFDAALNALSRSTGLALSLVEGDPVNPVCVPEPPVP